jgi:hypothetical protein
MYYGLALHFMPHEAKYSGLSLELIQDCSALQTWNAS